MLKSVLPPISTLPAAQQRYFLVEQCRTPAIINLILNGVIAWFLFSSLTRIPLWGGAGANIGSDLLITSILLPMLICLITSPMIASQVRKGKVSTLPEQLLPTTAPGSYPLFARSVWLAAAGVVVAALPLIICLSIANIEFLLPWQLISLKAIWAGALAALVSPWIAWWAIAKVSESLYLGRL